MARRSTNAFGEPMQGSKIQGAGALARARGYAYGSLSTQQRGAYGSQKNFQKAAEAAASRADSPSETDKAREERLKKKGREEILNRQPQFVKPVTKSETPSTPRPPQKAAQNKPQAASMGEKWSDGVDIPGMGKVGFDRRPSPLQPAKPRVKYDTPTPSAEALRKLRRKINRNEQRPSYFSSGQVNRGDW